MISGNGYISYKEAELKLESINKELDGINLRIRDLTIDTINLYRKLKRMEQTCFRH